MGARRPMEQGRQYFCSAALLGGNEPIRSSEFLRDAALGKKFRKGEGMRSHWSDASPDLRLQRPEPTHAQTVSGAKHRKSVGMILCTVIVMYKGKTRLRRELVIDRFESTVVYNEKNRIYRACM